MLFPKELFKFEVTLVLLEASVPKLVNPDLKGPEKPKFKPFELAV